MVSYCSCIVKSKCTRCANRESINPIALGWEHHPATNKPSTHTHDGSDEVSPDSLIRFYALLQNHRDRLTKHLDLKLVHPSDLKKVALTNVRSSARACLGGTFLVPLWDVRIRMMSLTRPASLLWFWIKAYQYIHLIMRQNAKRRFPCLDTRHPPRRLYRHRNTLSGSRCYLIHTLPCFCTWIRARIGG